VERSETAALETVRAKRRGVRRDFIISETGGWREGESVGTLNGEKESWRAREVIVREVLACGVRFRWRGKQRGKPSLYHVYTCYSTAARTVLVRNHRCKSP